MKNKIKEAIKYFEDAERLTVSSAHHVRSLKKGATDQEIKEAKTKDINWFRGFGDRIINSV